MKTAQDLIARIQHLDKTLEWITDGTGRWILISTETMRVLAAVETQNGMFDYNPSGGWGPTRFYMLDHAQDAVKYRVICELLQSDVDLGRPRE